MSATAATVGFPACSQIGFAFVKMFQIIEILAKLIYLPVKFSGKIQGMLEAIAELGDPIDIPEDIFMNGGVLESHVNFKGKIVNYEEYGNILQSMPVSTAIYLILEFVIVFAGSWNWPRLTRTVFAVQLFFVETSVIEFLFYTLLNVTIYPRITEKTLMSTVSFVISLYILVTITLKYYLSFAKMKSTLRRLTFCSAKALEDIQVEIGFEGLFHGKVIQRANENIQKDGF